MKKSQTLQSFPQKKKQSSFLKFFCPCLCAKEDKSQKNDATIQRHQFYEQKTQKEQHEQTEANLPIKQLSEFDNNQFKNKLVYQNKTFSNKENLNNKKQVITKLIRQEESVSPASKQINFKIKRTNNLEGYLSNNGANIHSNKDQVKTKNSIESEGAQKVKMNEKKQLQNQQLIQKPQIDFQNKQNSKQQLNLQKNGSNLKVSTKNNSQKRLLQKIYSNNINSKINPRDILAIEKKQQKMDQVGDYQFLKNWQQSYQNLYPINQYKENKVFVIGNNKGRLLTKITRVNLFPYPSAIQRYKDSLKNKKLNKIYNKPQKNFNSQLDKYWDKRYFLFEKFDQGIKLDEQSWYSVTPQSVADYISSKFNVKQTILDAFCGAGGDSIKLSTSCKRVISNDIDEIKIKCLIQNAKIYDVQNIDISCNDFFKLNCKVDAVYLAPPWGGPDYYKIQSFDPEDFQPKLSSIFQKALSLSHNFCFLLPANIEIEKLASIICQKIRDRSSKLQQSKFIAESCSLKLQKIFYNQRLKFLFGIFGDTSFQRDVKLTEQLDFIYQILREDNTNSQDERIFKHKKLLRKIRQQYGMVNLLNYVFECQNSSTSPLQNVSMVEKFQNYIVAKKLISKNLLQKIKQEQNMEYEYELKNRQNKNKKQKSKRIQKQKEKQTRDTIQNNQSKLQNNLIEAKKNNYFSTQNEIDKRIKNKMDLENDFEELQQIEEIEDQQIPIDLIINQATIQNKKQGISKYRNQLKQTLSSKFSNLQSEINSNSNSQQHSGINYSNERQSQNQINRQSLRTVSIISQFQQDQLNKIQKHTQRLRTNSDISILDSIYPIQKFDSLQGSMDINEFHTKSYRFPQRQNEDQNDKNNLKSSQNGIQQYLKNKNNSDHRQSAPIYLSPRQNVKMIKNKNGNNFYKGTVYEVNQEKQRDS